MSGLFASWRGFGAVFAALLIAVLALAPSLDKLICRDEAPVAVAEVSLDGKASHLDAAGQDQDGHADPDICIHGHCHHGAPYLSAPIGELAMLDALPDHHELTLGRVSASDRQFGLDRPPRA